MYIKCVPAGAISANCFVICDKKTKVGAVIDPGAYDYNVKKAIADAGIEELKYILCTHGHFDHISGIADLKEDYPEAKICIGKEDAPMLSDGNLNMANYFGMPFSPCYADAELSDGDVIMLSDIEITVACAPGHSPGGVLYVLKNEKVIFSGDTLFCGSIGRTDLYGGNYSVLMKTLKELKKYPEDFLVYTGHGESTTIGRELKNNIYLL